MTTLTGGRGSNVPGHTCCSSRGTRSPQPRRSPALRSRRSCAGSRIRRAWPPRRSWIRWRRRRRSDCRSLREPCPRRAARARGSDASSPPGRLSGACSALPQVEVQPRASSPSASLALLRFVDVHTLRPRRFVGPSQPESRFLLNKATQTVKRMKRNSRGLCCCLPASKSHVRSRLELGHSCLRRHKGKPCDGRPRTSEERGHALRWVMGGHAHRSSLLVGTRHVPIECRAAAKDLLSSDDRSAADP